MKINQQELQKIIKFCLTGVLNTVNDTLIFILCYSYFKLPEWPSQGIAFSIAVFISYIINRKWTFKTQNTFLGHEFYKFMGLGIFTTLISMGAIYLFSQYVFAGIQWPEAIADFLKNEKSTGNEMANGYLSKLFVIPVVMTVNFLGNRFWVFKPKKA